MGSTKFEVNKKRHLTYFNMKSKLAVFDFDLTIREVDKNNDWQYGVGHLFPGGKLPEELVEIRKKHGSKIFLQDYLTPLVNKMGLEKKELEYGFAYKNGSIIEKMDEVTKYLSKDHDIIMISGTFRSYTDNFLKRYGLFEHFEEIFASPGTITEQGEWKIGQYDQSKWGPPCKACHDSFCKKHVMHLFAKDRNYQEIKYFGDGLNDSDAAMSLKETDTVFPRKDYKLDFLISNEDIDIKANVCPWKDGSDILAFLK